MRGDVKLRYCKVGDEICSVSEFAHLSPKERPFSICPERDQPVILKLGSSGKVAHHAAHQCDNKLCSLTSPESALHFNTKIYICNELMKGSKLFLKQRCAGWTLPFTKVKVPPPEAVALFMRPRRCAITGCPLLKVPLIGCALAMCFLSLSSLSDNTDGVSFD